MWLPIVFNPEIKLIVVSAVHPLKEKSDIVVIEFVKLTVFNDWHERNAA